MQIIYNVTVNVEDSIHNEWLNWIKIHIPQVLATGNFTEARFTKVLTDDHQIEGTTYSIQYKAKDRKALQNYYDNHADRLRQEGLTKFAGKSIAFRTELEVIDEFSVTFN